MTPPRSRRSRAGFRRLGLILTGGAALSFVVLVPRPMAAAPVLTEFMADNESTLFDEDGDASDWIEVFNPDPESVDLDGHFLTDDPATPAKWRLPSVVLPGGGFLVVFASGKDRTDPDSELHTSFRLDREGGFVALVATDGTTVLSAFGAPGSPYPSQRPDVSFGAAADVEQSVVAGGPGASVRLLVPSSAGDLDAGWREPEFDDAGWDTAILPVGFDTGNSPAGGAELVAYWPLDEGTGSIAANRADRLFDATVTGDPAQAWSTDAPPTGAAASLAADGAAIHAESTWPGIAGAATRSVTFWVRSTDSGDHGIVAWGDSTANTRKWHLRINSSSSNGTVGAIRCEVQGGFIVGSTRIDDGAWHHVAAVFEEDGSPNIEDVALYIDGRREAVSGVNPIGVDTDTSGANALPLTIGLRVQGTTPRPFTGLLSDVAIFASALDPEQVAALAEGISRPGDLAGFDDLVATDLEARMLGQRSSAFLRLAFPRSAIRPGDLLALRAQVDDGFVAWLNGIEVARLNAPDQPAWNSTATAARRNSDAVVPLAASLDSFRDALVDGANVLAVQALNVAPDDGDFLAGVELVTISVGGAGGGFFPEPTPGLANTTAPVEAFVADTRFSVRRGFFDAPFDLEITSKTEGAEIRFTTDGSVPTPESGTRYIGPMRIATTTVVRAAAFKEGLAPTNIDTQTYVFPDDVVRQPRFPDGFPTTWQRLDGTRASDYEMDPNLVGSMYSEETVKASLRSLPTISLVGRIEDFFDPRTGFYVNSQQKGDAWERPVSVEFFDFPHGDDKQVDAGIRTVGRASRNPNRQKHNLRVVFRREYGASRLRFKLFEDSEVDSFNSLILRGGNGDSWINSAVILRAQYIRDQWHRDAMGAIGAPHMVQNYCHLYINGLYWGMFHVFEREEDDAFAERFGGAEEEWDVVKDAGTASVLETVDGTLDTWNDLLRLARGDTEDPAVYAAIQETLDLDWFIDYLLVNFYSGNNDWDTSNWRAARRRVPGAKWMFFPHDSERTDVNATGVPNGSTGGPITIDVTNKNVSNFPTSVHQRLARNPEYRLRFADRVQRHCFGNGGLTPENAAALWNARAGQIREALVAEACRWGDVHAEPPMTREGRWQAMLDFMNETFFPQRRDILIGQLRRRGLFPGTEAPAFNRESGRVPAGTAIELAAAGGNGAIWFTTDGSDPRVPPSEDEGLVLLDQGSEARAFIPTDGSLGTSWTNPVFDDSTWTAGVTGAGFELFPTDFVGLIGLDLSAMRGVNASAYLRIPFELPAGTTPGSLAGLTLEMKFDDGFVAWLNGTPVAHSLAPPPNQVAWDSQATGSRSDDNVVIFEPFDLTPHLGALTTGTNVLAIQVLNTNAGGSDLLAVPRLTAREGGGIGVGPSAVRYEGPIELAGSTRIRARVLAGDEWSPIVEETFLVGEPAAAENLVVSEFSYRPLGPQTPAEAAAGADRGAFEFIELMNVGDGPVDLSGVRFTEGITHEVPVGIRLDPGQRFVLAADAAAFTARYGFAPGGVFAGSLDNSGETLALVDAAGAPIRRFRFDDRAPWPQAADGGGFSLVLVAPDSDPVPDHTDPANWRPSASLHGSPGGDDRLPAFAGDAQGDADGNGVADLVDHALGASAGLVVLPPAGGSEGGFTVVVPRRLGADDVAVIPERSSDLRTWTSGAGAFEFLGTDTAAGTLGESRFRLLPTAPAPGDPESPRIYVRVRVQPR